MGNHVWKKRAEDISVIDVGDLKDLFFQSGRGVSKTFLSASTRMPMSSGGSNGLGKHQRIIAL